MTIKKTDSQDIDFQGLVKELDIELNEIDGEQHSFYDQYNTSDNIKYVIIAYLQNSPVGCGALKEYTPDCIEVKRMYVKSSHRGKGIASEILKALEIWSRELGYSKCILETGKRQPDAIHLYKKNHYKLISNYGQYLNIENSVCFEKKL